MILFLDFDGVLHPANVRMAEYDYRGPLTPEMMDPNHSLFCWVDLFERILDDEDPNGLIKIILSTSWGHYFGLAGARSYLPETLQARVIGKIDPGTFSRGELILAHARRSQLENWIALDDDPNPWPNDYLDRLVLCDPKTGISNVEVQEQLRNKLGQYLFRY